MFYRLADVLPGHFGAEGLFERDARGIDALHHGEARLEQFFAVAYPAGDEAGGHARRTAQDAHRQFAHQRLAVGRTLAGDDEVGIGDDVREADGIQQQLGAGLAVGMQVLQEGVAQTTGGSGTGVTGMVVAEVAG